MKIYPECYPCIVGLAVRAVQTTGVDKKTQFQILDEVLRAVHSADKGLSPSAVAGETNRIIREMAGVDDFFQDEKERSHALAMSYLENLRTLVRQTDDPLEQALKVAAAGNIIDVVHVDNYNLWDEVTATVERELTGGGLEAFRDRLETVESILYLADNVGETVFDRVLIETLPLPVIYSVKSGPILNDATREDAVKAGIDQVAEIVENGTRSPGTVLSEVSDEFRELFEKADLVLSKGQANYETIDEQGDKVFFLLRVKCPLLSQELEAPVGSLVFKQGRPLS